MIKSHAVCPPTGAVPGGLKTKMDVKAKRRSRVWFADEVPGRQLVEIVEVECLNSQFVPELWSNSLCPLWSCSECTFINEKPDALACLVCGTPRWENDNPNEYLDRLALRTSAKRRGSGRPKSPSATGKIASSLPTQDPLRSVEVRPGTPANRSTSCRSEVECRAESGVVPERPEIQFRERVQELQRTYGFRESMSRPQASAHSSAVRGSSESSVGRHEMSFAGATKAKKDNADQRLPHRRVTEGMVDSIYNLQTGSSRASQSHGKSLLKTPSPFRRLDLDGLPSLDLPAIGSSPCRKIKSGMAHQQHEQLSRREASPQTFTLNHGAPLTLGRRPESSMHSA